MEGEYIDHGVSGRRARRPALDEMRAKASRREIDAILVSRLDRGAVLRKRRAKVSPNDLRQAKQRGTVSPEIKLVLRGIEDELADLVDALGGLERLSPQRKAILDDVARAGLVAAVAGLRYVQEPDDADAAKLLLQAGAGRLRGLRALGLDRAERDVPSLGEYLGSKAEEGSK